MPDESKGSAVDDESASTLRAIFEILSYILVDAQRGNYTELADRIEFALNLAENMIKSGKSAPAGASAPDVGSAAIKVEPSNMPSS